MDVRTGTASLCEYIREDGEKWTCFRNGDTSFLAGGEERNWWFDGDIPGDDPEITELIAQRDSDDTKPKL
jgi:hypothetical protein